VIVSIFCTGNARSLIQVGNIASYLMFNECGLPVALGIEHWFLEGTAWSFSCDRDENFQKLLDNSGLLRTIIPGMPYGASCVLCTPFLRKGIPRWFSPMDVLFVDADGQRTSLYALRRNAKGILESCHCVESDFAAKRERFLS
jgi:hypothetical protein